MHIFFNYCFTSCEFFIQEFAYGLSVESAEHNVSSGLQSSSGYPTDINNSVVFDSLPLMSVSSFFSWGLNTVSSAPTTFGITVTRFFYNF